MWVVDSTVWIDYLAGRDTSQTYLLHRALGLREIGLFDIVLCEVLQGIRSDTEFETAKTHLLRFPIISTGGVHLAVKSAMNYRYLRQRGVTVRKTIDCLIATAVIDAGHELLHNDRDFEPFAAHLGLLVVGGSI